MFKILYIVLFRQTSYGKSLTSCVKSVSQFRSRINAYGTEISFWEFFLLYLWIKFKTTVESRFQ